MVKARPAMSGMPIAAKNCGVIEPRRTVYSRSGASPGAGRSSRMVADAWLLTNGEGKTTAAALTRGSSISRVVRAS